VGNLACKDANIVGIANEFRKTIQFWPREPEKFAAYLDKFVFFPRTPRYVLEIHPLRYERERK
jgi:hypothetical protein